MVLCAVVYFINAKPVSLNNGLAENTRQVPSTITKEQVASIKELATTESPEFWTRWNSDAQDANIPKSDRELYLASTLFTEKDGSKFVFKVRKEKIVSLKSGCGQGKNRLATLSDGTKICCRYREVQWRDIRGEFYSYHLNNFLRLFNAPPAVLMRVNFSSPQWEAVVSSAKEAGWLDYSTIVVTQYLEDLVEEKYPPILKELNTLITEQTMKDISSEEKDHLFQWSDLIVFDFIIGHSDRLFNTLFNLQWNSKIFERPVHNLLKTKEGKLLLFDNESGFWMGYKMKEKSFKYELQEKFLKKLCVFRDRTIERVKYLLNGSSEKPGEKLEMYIKQRDIKSYEMVNPLDDKQHDEFQLRLRLVLEQIKKCKV